MDTAWVVAARAGDEGAFARLVESHFRAVYGVAFSTVGQWDGAEDVAQEAFLVAWTNLPRLQTPEAFSGWLCAIARNLARNWCRSAGYRRSLIEHQCHLHAAAQQADAVDNLQREERHNVVWSALQTLSPPLREAVILYYLEDRSIAETAHTLGVTEAAARKRLQYARPKLRAHFEKQWAAEVDRERERLRPGEAARRFRAGLALGPLAASLKAARTGGPLAWAGGHTMAAHSTLPVVVATAAVAALLGLSLWWLVGWKESGPPPEGPETPVASTALAPSMASSVEVPAARPPAAAGSARVLKTASAPATPAPALATTPFQGRVTGRVLDEAGQPVAAARVTAFVTGAMPPLSPESPLQFSGSSYRADAPGATPLDGPPPLSDDLRARMARDAAGGSLEQVRFHAAVDAALDDPASHLTGLSGADGTFQVSIAQPGTVLVQATAEGYDVGGTMVVLGADGPDREALILLAPGVAVEGVVLNSNGAPVEDARLQCTGVVQQQTLADGRVSASSWSGGLPEWGWTFADERGRFRLPIRDFGLLTVRVISPSRGTVTLEAIPAAPDLPVELRLPKPAGFQGRVTHADGSPAEDHTLVFMGYPEPLQADGDDSPFGGTGAVGSSRTDAHAVTDAAGWYRVDRLDATRHYAASVYDPQGKLIAMGLDVAAPAEGRMTSWSCRLPKPLTVEGIVAGAVSGRPLEGIRVRAVTDADGAFAAETVTRTDGSYTLQIFSGPGRYLLSMAYTVGLAAPVEAAVDVMADAPARADLQLLDPWTWPLRAVAANGQPLAGVTVDVEMEQAGHTAQARLSATTGPDGSIRVTGLQPNCPCRCVLSLGGFEPAQTSVIAGAAGESAPEEVVSMYPSAAPQG